jgi:ZIP family zinc transporter
VDVPQALARVNHRTALSLDPASGLTGALTQAFAGGALLAMVADELLPEAYEVEGVLTGVLLVVGFATSIMLDAL